MRPHFTFAALMLLPLPATAGSEYELCVALARLSVTVAEIKQQGVTQLQARDIAEQASLEPFVRQNVIQMINDIYVGPLANASVKDVGDLAIRYVRNTCSRLSKERK